ncbi:hypothetical protein Tco_0301821 [Tanacetum coccineum]
METHGKEICLRRNANQKDPGCSKHMTGNRQFCDSDLEVAFRKRTDILKGSRGTNLYMISIDEMMKSSPIS